MDQQNDSYKEQPVFISDENFSLGKSLSTLQSIITLVLGLGAFLTGTGYIIVSFSLARFTDIHGFTVNSIQYLAAGISLLIFITITMFASFTFRRIPTIIWIFIDTIFFKGFFKRLLLVIFIIIYSISTIYYEINRVLIIALLLSMSPYILYFKSLWILLRQSQYSVDDRDNLRNTIHDLFENYLISTQSQIKSLIQNPLTRVGFNVAVFLGVYTLFGGVFFASSIYRIIPHYLGGGAPDTVILVFNDSETFLRLNIAPDQRYDNRTQNLLLLANLVDGILILDPLSGQVVAVKNDSILAVYDDKVNETYRTTPTPTPATTFTPTPTDILTLTPVATTGNP